MISIKKILDRYSGYFYNLAVGSSLIMLFDNDYLSPYVTIISLFCATWLGMIADSINE